MLKLDVSVRMLSVNLVGSKTDVDCCGLAERDSPKSHFIIVCFLIIVSTLLVLAGLKHYGFDLGATFNRSGAKGVITVRGCSSFSYFRGDFTESRNLLHRNSLNLYRRSSIGDG